MNIFTSIHYSVHVDVGVVVVGVPPTIANASFASPAVGTRQQLQSSSALTSYAIAAFSSSGSLGLGASNYFWLINGTDADFNQVSIGTQYVASNVGPSQNNSVRTTITQSLTFTTSGTFFLTFKALRRNATYAGTYYQQHQMRAIINGNTITTTSLTTTDSSWVTYKQSFTINAAGTYPLVFETFLNSSLPASTQSGILLAGLSITLT